MSETNSPWRMVRSTDSSAVDRAVAGPEDLADAGSLDHDRSRATASGPGDRFGRHSIPSTGR